MSTERRGMKEVIKHAAILGEVTGFVALGKSHGDCFHQAVNTGIVLSRRYKSQGFMTSKGRYVDREEAFKIAVDADQFDPTGKGGVLCSEDLWSPMHEGRYDYDSVEGYVLRGEVLPGDLTPEQVIDRVCEWLVNQEYGDRITKAESYWFSDHIKANKAEILINAGVYFIQEHKTK